MFCVTRFDAICGNSSEMINRYFHQRENAVRWLVEHDYRQVSTADDAIWHYDGNSWTEFADATLWEPEFSD